MIPLRPRADAVAKTAIAGFTLVELMVVIVVLALLAGLTLTGLSGVRDRSKADKTRSTIRKLNDIILPQYESYLTRRVPVQTVMRSGSFNPNGQFTAPTSPISTATSSTVSTANRLWGLRLLMALEMPDQWSDVAPTDALPTWAVTSPVKRYAALKASNKPSTAYEGAECLAMIVMRGGFDADSLESFRADEVGDVDGDRHPEFLDGWGKPIGFIRWPVGYISTLQPQDASSNPDPFDPMQRSGTTAYPDPSTPPQPDYGVTPLIYSGGPDAASDSPPIGSSATTPSYGGYYTVGDIPPPRSWVQILATPSPTLLSGTVPSLRTIVSGTIGPGTVANPAAVQDNITSF